ncbi:MAG: ATP-binding protein [Armatimonadetes bacterium]|nr:ATP-binding protein [Armatimonadota bacterium]
MPHWYGGWNPQEVNADLIRQFVTERRKEDANLQFKGGKAIDPATTPDKQKRQQVLRDILARYACAFANTEGGLLVIGVHTETDPKSKRDVATNWECTGEELSAQRITELVSGVADPAFTSRFLSGVNADTFDDPGHPGRHGCWVLIPKSDDATHQVVGGKYDGQYLVSTQEGVIRIRHDDLVRRLCGRGAKLAITEVKLRRGTHGQGGSDGAHTEFVVTLRVRNSGTVSATDLAVEAYVAEARTPGGARAEFGARHVPRDEWPRVSDRGAYCIRRHRVGETLHGDSEVDVAHHVRAQAGRSSPLDMAYVAAYRAKSNEGESPVYAVGFGARCLAEGANAGWGEPFAIRELSIVDADEIANVVRVSLGPNAAG